MDLRSLWRGIMLAVCVLSASGVFAGDSDDTSGLFDAEFEQEVECPPTPQEFNFDQDTSSSGSMGSRRLSPTFQAQDNPEPSSDEQETKLEPEERAEGAVQTLNANDIWGNLVTQYKLNPQYEVFENIEQRMLSNALQHLLDLWQRARWLIPESLHTALAGLETEHPGITAQTWKLISTASVANGQL